MSCLLQGRFLLKEPPEYRIVGRRQTSGLIGMHCLPLDAYLEVYPRTSCVLRTEMATSIFLSVQRRYCHVSRLLRLSDKRSKLSIGIYGMVWNGMVGNSEAFKQNSLSLPRLLPFRSLVNSTTLQFVLPGLHLHLDS